jgi:hypothetical protein
LAQLHFEDVEIEWLGEEIGSAEFASAAAALNRRAQRDADYRHKADRERRRYGLVRQSGGILSPPRGFSDTCLRVSFHARACGHLKTLDDSGR